VENRAKSDEKRGLWGVVRLFVKPTHVAMVLRHGWGTRIVFFETKQGMRQVTEKL
jgi:hypothetical protein